MSLGFAAASGCTVAVRGDGFSPSFAPGAGIGDEDFAKKFLVAET